MSEQEFNPLEGWTKEQIKSVLKANTKTTEHYEDNPSNSSKHQQCNPQTSSKEKNVKQINTQGTKGEEQLNNSSNKETNNEESCKYSMQILVQPLNTSQNLSNKCGNTSFTPPLCQQQICSLLTQFVIYCGVL